MKAPKVGRKLAWSHPTVPIIDLLVAATALESNMILWTIDSDFKRAETVTNLRTGSVSSQARHRPVSPSESNLTYETSLAATQPTPWLSSPHGADGTLPESRKPRRNYRQHEHGNRDCIASPQEGSAELLMAIYEQDFRECCSYEFGPERGPQGALDGWWGRSFSTRFWKGCCRTARKVLLLSSEHSRFPR